MRPAGIGVKIGRRNGQGRVMGAAATTGPKQYVVYLKSASAAGRKSSADNAAGLSDDALLAEHKAASAILQSIKRRVQVLEREIKRRK